VAKPISRWKPDEGLRKEAIFLTRNPKLRKTGPSMNSTINEIAISLIVQMA
jgi:hypothetical protein